MLEIEFLTSEEDLRELSRQYWQLGQDGDFVHSIVHLAEVFGIPRNGIPARVFSSSRAFRRDECCPSCGAARPFTSRSDYVERAKAGRWATAVCDACRDAERAETERQARQREAQRAAIIRQELDYKRERMPSFDELSFKDVIYLVSVLRVGAAEDMSYILPAEFFRTQLSPTAECDREVLDYLYRRGLLCIHPGSRPESVVIENGRLARFYPLKVHWLIPLSSSGPTPARFLEDLEHSLREGNWSEHWQAESRVLHTDLALQECLQYLRVILEEHGFELNVGEKTVLVLRAALRSFSIGQVFNFMWRAARDAAAFYVREAASKSHAANIVPGSIQRSAERAIAEGWSVRAFRRDFRAPQSVLTQVLFTAALKLPEGGFETVPPSDDPIVA